MVKYAKKSRRARSPTRSLTKKRTRAVKEAELEKKQRRAKSVKKPARKTKTVSRTRKPKKRVVARKPVAKKRARARKPAIEKKRKTVRKGVAKKRVIPRKLAAKKRAPARKPVAKKRVKKTELQQALQKAEERALKAETELNQALENMAKILETTTSLQEQLATERKLREVAEVKARAKVFSRAEQQEFIQERKETFRNQEVFDSVFEIARQTGQIPSPAHGFGVTEISTPDRQGERMTIAIDMMLRPETMAEIMKMIQEKSQELKRLPYPSWLSQITVVGFGDKLVGYGATKLTLDDPVSQWFQKPGDLSTGIRTSYVKMIEEIGKILDEQAHDDSAVLYVTHVTILAFVSIIRGQTLLKALP